MAKLAKAIFIPALWVAFLLLQLAIISLGLESIITYKTSFFFLIPGVVILSGIVCDVIGTAAAALI